MPEARILVVEDEPDVCAALHSFLGRRGYEVSTTASGTEALKLISVIRPDLVLLDINLEGISGIDVLRQLRRYDAVTRVMVVTGHFLSPKASAELTALGVAAIFNKPVSLARLGELVEGFFDGAPVPEDAVQVAGAKPVAEAPDRHKVANLLGAIRQSCEAFVIDDEEGFHLFKPVDEIRAESTRVMRGVIENVDRITQHLEDSDGR
ncbi:MAG: response regulator [Candidatus Omnitrophota bacterium]